MLTCALIVWILQPEDFKPTDLRKTFLTQQECKSNQKDNTKCLKIDKRYSLTEREWKKDNCSISEHKWLGKK
tara:strand:+ start:64 stop:279 length:216 start_codon:yes stop_codon:yes gene_type:complete